MLSAEALHNTNALLHIYDDDHDMPMSHSDLFRYTCVGGNCFTRGIASIYTAHISVPSP